MNHATMARRLQGSLKRSAQTLGKSTPVGHQLYIQEGATKAQSASTGLMVFVDGVTTEMYPPPRVLVGGSEVVTDGASQRVGDARVSRIDPAVYPLARLLAANGFYLDDPEGERYTLLEGSIVDDGLSGLSMTLTREAQPRAITAP